jgi:hypothetical protein
MNPGPYLPNTVARHAIFIFDAGSPIFELVSPDGRRWVMQSWSQTADPALDYPDLAGLGSRLAPPEGWTYQSHVPETALRIDTSTTAAQVLQDDLANSYSLQA